MEVAQNSAALSQLTEPVVSIGNDIVNVLIPAIDDTVAWRVANTRRAESDYGPTGDLSVEFVIETEGEESRS